MDEQDRPEWEFKERDVFILQELSKDPQLSSRDIADLLESEHGIDVSHVTVSESIRKMRQAGVFRETIVPNESYYEFALFEFKFDPAQYDEGWRDAMESIRDDEHTLFYFLSDGEYQWKSIMMFPDQERESEWIHEFYREHGSMIDHVRTTVVFDVLKFQTEAELFNALTDESS